MRQLLQRGFLLLYLPCLALAAEDALTTVRASGEGSVSLKPDQATVTLGVVTQAPTADAAAAQNAKQLSAVLARLRADLGTSAEIRTAGYSLNPNYRYGNNTAPAITGYTATNTVLVRVDDLARLGAALDAATKTGANTVHGIAFGLKDEGSARAMALAEAARTARASAEAIARTLGLRVVRIRSAESVEAPQAGPLPQFRAMAAEARAAPAPVEAGTIDVRAAVTIVLEVAQ